MSVEERLERLERQNKWMRRLGAVGVALGAAVFLMGQGEEKEVPHLEVRSLTMKDGDGKVRAALRLKKADKMPTLVFFDSRGQRRAGLGMSPGGPGLRLYSHGIERTALLMGPDGPGLAFSGKNGNTRTALFALPDGALRLTLCDTDGKVRAELGTRADGTPGLRLRDAKGKVLWQAPKK